MTELEKRNKFNKLAGEYIKIAYFDEEEYNECNNLEIGENAKSVIEDRVVWQRPENGKKVPQNYICNICGRVKTVRFKTVPTPARHGKCPRCKKGTMYSELVYKERYKKVTCDVLLDYINKFASEETDGEPIVWPEYLKNYSPYK